MKSKCFIIIFCIANYVNACSVFCRSWRRQVMNCINVDNDPWCHLVSLGRNGLIMKLCCIYSICVSTVLFLDPILTKASLTNTNCIVIRPNFDKSIINRSHLLVSYPRRGTLSLHTRGAWVDNLRLAVSNIYWDNKCWCVIIMYTILRRF